MDAAIGSTLFLGHFQVMDVVGLHLVHGWYMSLDEFFHAGCPKDPPYRSQ